MRAKILLILFVTIGLSINSTAQINNGDMESITNPNWPWKLDINNTDKTSTPGAATMSYESYSAPGSGHFLQVVVSAANIDEPWNLRVKQGNVLVESDNTKITFKAKGSKGGESLIIRFEGDGKTKPQDKFNLTTTWTEYELELPATFQGTKNTLSFRLQSVGIYQFDEVVLK